MRPRHWQWTFLQTLFFEKMCYTIISFHSPMFGGLKLADLLDYLKKSGVDRDWLKVGMESGYLLVKQLYVGK